MISASVGVGVFIGLVGVTSILIDFCSKYPKIQNALIRLNTFLKQ